jgi:hypothetical protein
MPVILFFGTSGSGKRPFLNSFKRPRYRVFSTQLERSDWHLLDDEARRSALKDSIGRLGTQIRRRRGTYLVGVHATNLFRAALSSPVSIQLLKTLRPSFCVTLFDDLYAMHARLGERHPHKYQDLLLWKNAEFVVADIVAREIVQVRRTLPNPPNFYLAVKHPRKSVEQLLFQPAAPKVYASYSITGVLRQRDPAVKMKLIAETTRYRKQLYDLGLTVFDPATLDDRLLISEILRRKDRAPKTGWITIQTGDRWPYVIGKNEEAPCVPDPPNLFPLRVRHAEAFLLGWSPAITPHRPYGSDIDTMITQTDLRYVDQADFLAMWRPFSQGIESTGCLGEAKRAEEFDKPVVAFNPLEDDLIWERRRRRGPLQVAWPSNVEFLPEENRFWARVREMADSLQRRS